MKWLLLLTLLMCSSAFARLTVDKIPCKYLPPEGKKSESIEFPSPDGTVRTATITHRYRCVCIDQTNFDCVNRCIGHQNKANDDYITEIKQNLKKKTKDEFDFQKYTNQSRYNEILKKYCE